MYKRQVINKWDINERMSKKIERKFEGRVVGKISYDENVVRAIVNLKPVIEVDSKAGDEIREIYEKVLTTKIVRRT